MNEKIKVFFREYIKLCKTHKLAIGHDGHCLSQQVTVLTEEDVEDFDELINYNWIESNN